MMISTQATPDFERERANERASERVAEVRHETVIDHDRALVSRSVIIPNIFNTI